MSAYQELLEVGLELVHQASLIAMKYWRKEMNSELKSDGSTVTQVDLMIENMMRQTIKTLYPDHTIIGEEQDNLIGSGRISWIIDPIDGTRRFERGLHHWSVLLAVMVDDQVEIGICAQPALGQTTRAIRGGGSRTNGEQNHVSARIMKQAYVGMPRSSYFLKHPKTPDRDYSNLLNKLNHDTWYQWSSDNAYSLIAVAQGQMDGFVMTPAPSTNRYDNAPFVPIIEEAGGKVTDWKGKQIDDKLEFGMILSNGVVHDGLVEICEEFI